jgi:hypothetical protein
MSTDRSAHGPVFWLGAVIGLAVMAYGGRGLLADADATRPAWYATWLVGADLLHDVVLAPVVLLVGAAVARVVPDRVRVPVRFGLFAGAVVVAIAWPALRGYGRATVPDNPSVQPLDYATALATALAVVAGIAALWAVSLVVRRGGGSGPQPRAGRRA